LSAVIHTDGEFRKNKAKPIIVCCHGFTGDKVGANQLMLNLAKQIATAGYTVIRYDFAGSGESEGEFASETTVKGWQDDLRNVISWLKGGAEEDLPPIYLLGHSLGGLIALTSDFPGVAGRVALAPVIHPIENFRDIILGPELWQQSHTGNMIRNFYGKGFSLQPDFVRDLLQQEYEPLTAAAAFRTPLLIIHGNQDAALSALSGRKRDQSD